MEETAPASKTEIQKKHKEGCKGAKDASYKQEYNRLYYLKNRLEKGMIEKKPMLKLKTSLSEHIDKDIQKKIRNLETDNEEYKQQINKLQHQVIDKIKD